VSEPGHKGRSYQVLTRSADALYISPDDWQGSAPSQEGSWWPEWVRWLDARSGGRTTPPPIGGKKRDLRPLCDAPGTYVLQE
jgi:polyhydroxyalkanoate synthase